MQSIPVIDIAGLFSEQKSERIAVAKTIGQTCLDKGFFYIQNHGIDANLQQQVFAQSQQFFALDEQQKNRIHKNLSIANRGYEPLKNQTLEAGTPADLKEGFYCGREYAPNSIEVHQKKFNHGPNQWPTELDGFADTMMAYQAQLEQLAKTLMRGLALSLNLDEFYFDTFSQDALITLRLLHYPPQPANPEPNEKGCGAHTDFGALTLLLQDQNGGLQVWDNQHQDWIDAPPIEGTYVVNLGDLIARWTNDRYKSTLHRVINRSGRERYSVPFFFAGNPDYQVSCLNCCLDDTQTAKYPATTVEQHFIEMYRRTYG
ncbi:Isopenicillin N synthase [Acinetobacter marinus]|uniref:2-oxoglutarate-dependent ethylene/succinate-forming enzyme n=1 Tax=Acinetobacter marinus TaxID=281375 RepID=A0A1G6MZ62_9GAMM|nr:2-oxoglutarate and iron-dependent oxygenase domain-containing protein [Acinetobacter marinus]SDC60534.1 Isopenicillin N synthase [Acinetobacter marinus]